MYTDNEITIIKREYDRSGSYVQAAERVAEFGITMTPELARYYVGSKPKSDKKVLFFDIETAPMTVYTWGLWNQNIGISQIKEDWYVLMWAAKWLGNKDMLYGSLNQYEGYKGGSQGEYDVIMELWELLDAADIVVAQNGKNFDVKKMNAKFVEYDIPKPSHYKIVDTLQIARYNFSFSSNKLDYMADLFGHGNKNKTDFSLWKGCMDGDASSWKTMIDYCKQDVKLLEDVYHEIKAWDGQHPQFFKNPNACNVCGCENLEYSKDYETTASVFEVFRCGDCGHQQRSRKRIAKKDGMVNC